METKGDAGEETAPLHMETKDSKEDLRYGWRNVKPQCLQVLNSPKFFVFALATFGFVQGMCVSGFTNLYLLTLEKRFQLTSTEVGFVAASNDIAGIVLTALVSFYGTYGNKPRWLGYGCAITGLGCLIFVLPQALVGRYEPLLNSNGFGNGELCQLSVNGTSEFCFSNYGGRWYYIFIFFLAQLLMGGGTTPLYTLGPAYIDENVHPKSSPIYLAVFFASSLLGPGLGFISGGSLLKIYVDVTQPEGSNLTPDDPQWIGAWWIGFLFGGFILLLMTGLLLGFPRELPGAKRIREEAAKEGQIPKKDERLQGNIKDILPATLQLLKAPVFIFNSLGITSSSLFGAGIASFLPKILQLKYGLSPFITGVIIGTILVPGTVGGIFLGGFIVRKFDLKKSLKMAARFCVICQVFTIIGSGSWFIPGCGTPDLAGLLVPYHGSSSLGDSGMTAPCNVNCSCSLATINPVCGEDNLAYFSPCHAGCKVSQDEKSFKNCSCIYPQGNVSEGSAVKGYCEKRSGCTTYIAFILLLILVLFSVFITAISNKTVVLRCVPYNQRAYALGFQFILQRSLGFLPGPILFGAIFDSSCLLWGRSCGKKGNCQFFDMTKLTDRLGYAGFSFTGLSLIFYFLSYWFCKPTIEEEEEKHRLEQLPNKEAAENDDNANGMGESSI